MTWALANRALWIDKHLLFHSYVFCPMAGNTYTSLTSATVFFPRLCTLLHNCWSLEFTGLLAEFKRTAIPHFQLKILFPLRSIDTLCFWTLSSILSKGWTSLSCHSVSCSAGKRNHPEHNLFPSFWGWWGNGSCRSRNSPCGPWSWSSSLVCIHIFVQYHMWLW